MKKIDLEAHFYTQEYIEYLRSSKGMPREDRDGNIIRLWYNNDFWTPHSFTLEDSLLDLGEGRVKEMDATGIDMQVLSLSLPGCERFDAKEGTVWAKKTNDELSRVVKKHPDRFIGLAALAPQDPDGVADEMVRARRSCSR